jgi:methylated-DNA-[protein]-cysteine S-methyltransferase
MRDRASSVRLISETVDTPIGGLTLVADENGALFMAEFADCADRVNRWLQRRLQSGRYTFQRGEVPPTIKQAIAAYFGGDVDALRHIPLRLDGTAFQNEVWSALREIEPGRTFGYGAFADRLGRPQSARAVGHANGANPLSIVVPCHRLVGADGDLTNYGGGIERKRWLLDHEARHAGRADPQS